MVLHTLGVIFLRAHYLKNKYGGRTSPFPPSLNKHLLPLLESRAPERAKGQNFYLCDPNFSCEKQVLSGIQTTHTKCSTGIFHEKKYNKVELSKERFAALNRT